MWDCQCWAALLHKGKRLFPQLCSAFVLPHDACCVCDLGLPLDKASQHSHGTVCLWIVLCWYRGDKHWLEGLSGASNPALAQCRTIPASLFQPFLWLKYFWQPFTARPLSLLSSGADYTY